MLIPCAHCETYFDTNKSLISHQKAASAMSRFEPGRDDQDQTQIVTFSAVDPIKQHMNT